MAKYNLAQRKVIRLVSNKRLCPNVDINSLIDLELDNTDKKIILLDLIKWGVDKR